MNQDEFLDRLEKLVTMAVWNGYGEMYAPVWGTDGQVREYAPFEDASHALKEDFFNPYE
jgi:dTDP-D-glucose 4,6-dehydratase